MRSQPGDHVRVDRSRIGAAVAHPVCAARLDTHKTVKHLRDLVRRFGQPQLPDRFAQQLACELIARAFGHHQPVADDHNAVGQLLGLGQVMGRQQHGSPRRPQLGDCIAHGARTVGIHCCGRLIQEQYLGVVYQCADQGDLLLHAFGIAVEAFLARFP